MGLWDPKTTNPARPNLGPTHHVSHTGATVLLQLLLLFLLIITVIKVLDFFWSNIIRSSRVKVFVVSGTQGQEKCHLC